MTATVFFRRALRRIAYGREGIPDLLGGRWRLMPDCGIGRVFMRNGAAIDEETLQDRARDIYGQQPGAGRMDMAKDGPDPWFRYVELLEKR